MNERAIRFGDGERLCGILVEPDSRLSARLPAVIFISAGLLPKSGPYRMYTEFARSIAALGFATLRFDISGNGDSLGSTMSESADRTTVADTRLALDAMQDICDIHEFVLFGLCSGAEAAHRTALADERVRGVVALDGFIARNPMYYVRHYLPRIFSISKWSDFLRNKWKRFFSNRRRQQTPDEDIAFWDDRYPSREQLTGEHAALSERKVRQLQIFSGGSRNCSYQGQFRAVFRDAAPADLVEVHYFASADHTYVLREDRRQLNLAVCRWFRRTWLDAADIVNFCSPATRAGRQAAPDGMMAANFHAAHHSVERRSEEI